MFSPQTTQFTQHIPLQTNEKPGQTLGELAVFDENEIPSPVTVTADLDMEVLQLARSDLKEMIEEGHFKVSPQIYSWIVAERAFRLVIPTIHFSISYSR